ncbi:hypothetical protein OS493_027960 [Desmophyllum pertusum]|uniref:Death domain-containing protein n=1 Tax=Desmophyllum pertusum TaxID=174260 RepID=A0A9W9Y964_9CNID|nr:hypothetical protein OS493_027960 [Desmophyllum pertusum]
MIYVWNWRKAVKHQTDRQRNSTGTCQRSQEKRVSHHPGATTCMIKPTEEINWTVVVWSGLLRPSKRTTRNLLEVQRKGNELKVHPDQQMGSKNGTQNQLHTKQTMSAAVAGKRVLHGKKDVFKVPLENIVESVTYSTREKSEVFVETINKSMHSEIKMDSIAYLVSEGNPLDENGKLLDNNLYVLGGTHYLAALKKINEEKQMVEINAVIFKDLSDEETLWLGTQHNLSQHMCRRISAKEYMTNFRRLLLEGADLHKEPPQNPPKDWRLKCQGLLPEGKNINSYSPWLGMCRCPLSTWKLLEKVFEMYEKGEVKGMKKVGTTLESHRLWRELLKLDVQAKDKILKDIVDKRFSIGDAIQDAQNRQCLDRVRDTIAEQLDMEWLEIEEKCGSRVSSEVLLPYARLDNVELVPIVLNEFIEDLRDPGKRMGKYESLWKRGDEQLSSYGKDEIRLIIQKNRNRNQRQLFIVFTAFSMIPEVLNLADKLKLEPEVVVVRESECRKHKLTGSKLSAILIHELELIQQLASCLDREMRLIPNWKHLARKMFVDEDVIKRLEQHSDYSPTIRLFDHLEVTQPDLTIQTLRKALSRDREE